MEQFKTYFNWSSGKDAAMALYHLKKDNRFLIDKLLTSVNVHHDRVSMHGLRRELLERQIAEIGKPSTTIELPEEPTMEVYEEELNRVVDGLKSEGFTHSGFGDIFLEDLRGYREQQLKKKEIDCVFPLWKKDTKTLIDEFLQLGFRAVIICVKSEFLDESFAGREIDENFLNDLPDNVDPCGENGEFHTFCFDGPIFKRPVEFELGDLVYREYKAPSDGKQSMGFWFRDLKPVE